MSIRAIEIACETPDCGAFCSIDQPTADRARGYAAERWGWTHVDGRDVCNPCGRGGTPDNRREEP